MLLGMDWIMKDHDVAAVDRFIGKQMPPHSPLGVMDFIDQQVVADQQRILHRRRGNLKRLLEERDNKDRTDDGYQQRLNGRGEAKVALALRHYRTGRHGSARSFSWRQVGRNIRGRGAITARSSSRGAQ